VLQRIAGWITSALYGLRPHLKAIVPSGYHHSAGRVGRGVIRVLDGYSVADCRPTWHELQHLEDEGLSQGQSTVMVNASLQAGGAERQLVNLLRGLDKRSRHPHVLLCFHLTENEDQQFFARELACTSIKVRDALPLAAALTRLTSLCGDTEVRRLHSSLAWAPTDLRSAVIRLAAEFLGLKPAVVHGWQDATGLATAVAGLVCGTPHVIVNTRNLNPTNFAYFRSYMPALYRRLSEEPNVVLVNNSNAGARDYERWLGLDDGRFVVVRNGLDETALHPRDAQGTYAQRVALGVPPDAAIVGGIFRLEDDKRPLLWLEVARRVLDSRPNTYFLLYGGGNLESKTRARARKLGITRHLVMPGRSANPGEALSLFDVVLLTSAVEGTPNVVLEASMMGVPVVATAVGGTPETIVAGSTGLLVPSPAPGKNDDGLARQLADRVIEALESEELARSAFRHGPDFIREFYGLERMIAETQALHAGTGCTQKEG
jgi:glycosyltransferase involved in cell wall biosynthesis